MAPAVDVGETNATLRGRIVGGEDECEYYFLYWAEGQTATTSLTGCCEAPGETFSVAVANLQPQTQYFYQAHARNDAGSAAGATQTFTTGPHSPQEPAEKPAPGRLRINNVHKTSPTSTFHIVHQEGASDGPNDPEDIEYIIRGTVTIPYLASIVADPETEEVKLLTIDVRSPGTDIPVYFQHRIYSEFGFARISGEDTNALVFSFPYLNKNETFGIKGIKFQEVHRTDPNDFNFYEEGTPVLVRELIANDPNGMGVYLLPE